LQGSKIFVESQPDIGTNFYFGLDFDLPIEEFSSIEKEKQEIEPSLSHVKLLLVEDYKLNQMVVEEFLNIWNISVDIADNGKIAVEMADKKEYTIILMDLQMPIIDGYEATRLIRSLPNNKYKTVPIIALTASAIQETITRVKFSGMNDYITKPFKPDVLYKKIVQYTSNLS
jgi:CheY-like chemotaxis protein